MRRTRFLLILLMIGLGNTLFYAQGEVRFGELTPQQKEEFKVQARENIKNLGYNIGVLAKASDREVQEKIIEAQLRYFREGAMFQTGWIGKDGKVKTTGKGQTVEVYLRNKVVKYRKTSLDMIEIEFVSFNLTSDLKPVRGKPGMYYMEYEFIQVFRKGKRRKSREGLDIMDASYVDTTKKKGKIFIERKSTILGTKWKLFFGDITVDDVQA